MGRTPKKGVDYFPHDTDASTRMTVQALEMRYGNDGYAAWFKLLETLGRTETLSIDYTNIQERVFLVKSMGVMEEKALEMLDYMAELNAIDQELWRSRKIIWSQNFADRLIATVFKKRKDGTTPTKPGIPQDEPKSEPARQPEPAQEEKPPAEDDQYLFGLTDADIQKSLERDAEIESMARRYGLPCFEGNMITARDLADKYSMEWLLEAIRRSGEGKSQTWAYVKGILYKWEKAGAMDKPGEKNKKPKADEKTLEAWGGSL